MTAIPDRTSRAQDPALWPSQLVAEIAQQRPHSPWSPTSSPFASSSFVPPPRAPAPAAPAPAGVSARPRAAVAAGDSEAAPSAPSFARFLAVVTPLAFLLTFVVCSVLDVL